MKNFNERVTFINGKVFDGRIFNVQLNEQRFLVGSDVKVRVTVGVTCAGRENPELIKIGETGTLVVKDYYDDDIDLVVADIRHVRWENGSICNGYQCEEDDQVFVFETEV